MKSNTLNKYNNRKQKQSGFTLVSVVVGAALMSGLSLGFYSMVSQVTSTLGVLEDKTDSLDLKNIIALELANPTACLNTFGGNSISARQNISQIKNAVNAVSYQNNQEYNRLNIIELNLVNQSVPSAPSSTGNMNLEVVVQRIRSTGVQDLRPLVIPIQVTTNPSGVIAECTSISNGAALAQQELRRHMNQVNGQLSNMNSRIDDLSRQLAQMRRQYDNSIAQLQDQSDRGCEHAGRSYSEGEVRRYSRVTSNAETHRTYLCIDGAWRVIAVSH